MQDFNKDRKEDAKYVQGQVESKSDDLGDKARGAWEDTKGAVSDAAGSVQRGAESAGDKVRGKYEEIKGDAKGEIKKNT